MHANTIYIALVALLVLTTDAKKSNRDRHLKEAEESTPQPNVVSYSTFGFNDVGSHDGFVPSSPGYSSYLSSLNQENPGQTRLYAPAFPTAQDATGPANGPGIQPLESYTIEGDNSQASVMQYQNFVNQNIGNNDHEARVGSELTYSQNSEYNPPIYGTKLSTRGRGKFSNHYNNTDDYSSGPSSSGDDKQISFQEPQQTQEVKPSSYSEVSTNYQNYYNYAPTYPPSNAEDYGKTEPIPSSNGIKFPKVIDFTKVKQFYPSAIENKYASATASPSNPFASMLNNQNGNFNPSGNEEIRNNYSNQSKYSFKTNNNENDEKDSVNPNLRDAESGHDNHYFSNTKHRNKSKQPEYKDQFKYKPWLSKNESETKFSRNPFKGFQYSTDHSNASFKLDFDGNRKPTFSEQESVRKPAISEFDYNRKPSNINTRDEELIPASSNIVDLSNYPFSDNDYSSFKKFPKNNYAEDFEESIKNFYKHKPDELTEQYKNIFNAEPSISTQQWGNIFKSSDYSYKQFNKKPQISEVSDEIVHIPKRPQGQKLFTPESEDWPYTSTFKPQKFRGPSEWNKDVSNRFKSEEDLLGLRTRDTSHPSYLPTYRPSQVSSHSAVLDDTDYKQLVEKWKQSYWRAKYKNNPYHDFEGFSSDTKTTHVPVPKPYAIEIPHPIIVPVPQPYPVRVPVPKPVAVPVIQELTVPVERPVPYPVVKNVPFPIEKMVPVRIEKKVPVPVVKPYPVAIPHIRPVFHHGKPPREEFESDRNLDDDDFAVRPEYTKKVPYVKRPSKRPQATRSRRPSRMSYQDRTHRRWPNKQSRGAPRPQRHPEGHGRPRKPSPDHTRYHQRYHEFENEEFDRESEYSAYCKRTGKC